MIRQAKIKKLEAELAALRAQIQDAQTTTKKLDDIKKLFYYTYGEKHYDVGGWNKYVIDGWTEEESGCDDYRPDEHFTMTLETTNIIIKFDYLLTNVHQETLIETCVLTDKTKYSETMDYAEWKQINTPDDIPAQCNAFELDLIVTFMNEEVEPLFYMNCRDNVEIPTVSKFKPRKRLPKVFMWHDWYEYNELKNKCTDYEYDNSSSGDEECKLSPLV